MPRRDTHDEARAGADRLVFALANWSAVESGLRKDVM